jgi:hypothetical protein
MGSRTVRNLVITAPDGTDVIDRTGGGYDTAGIARNSSGGWSLVAHGWSHESVRRRTKARSPYSAEIHVGPLHPQTAPVIRDYFSTHNVLLVQVFVPGKGWVKPETTDAGTSTLRKLSYAKATAVAVRPAGSQRTADFQMDEILNSMKTGA